MPRSNKRGAGDSAGPARRSSRTPARTEAEVKKTRGASASSDAAASPAKSSRKASPSPAPTGRGRSARGAAKADQAKSGEGDQKKGRVTRAVVKEKEEETVTSRGRSNTRKSGKAKEEPAPSPKPTGRAKSGTPAKATPKKQETPKGGRGRSARGRGKKEEQEEEKEDEEEEAEEEMEEEPEPPKKETPKSTPKGRGKTPAKKTPNTTPKQSGSRSRGRGGNKDDVTSPTVVLEKMDDSDISPAKDAPEESKAEEEVKSPRGRRGRNVDPKPTPSPSPRSRSRRGAKKDEVVEEPSEEKEEEKVEESKEEEKVEESKEESAEKDDESKVETEEAKTDDQTGNAEESKEAEEMETNEQEADPVQVDEKTEAEPVADASEKEDVENDHIDEAETKDQSEDEQMEEEKSAEPEAVQEAEAVQETDPVVETEAEPIAEEEEEEAAEEPVKADPPAEVPQSIPSINVIEARVEISDEETTSSVVVEPPTSEQISEESDVQEVESVPVPVQNSVEEETMDVEANQVDGEQNGETENRKRKIEDVEETEEDQTEAKRSCVVEEQVSQPVQENGEASASSQEVVQQYADDATIHNVEEDYVMVNTADVPDSNSKEVLESIPQIDSVKSNKLGPLFNRKFIANPAFDMDKSDSAKQFTVVSYNILAQCHLESNDYSFTSPEFLSLEYRHQKMMTEFQYLDADVVCLQEVGPAYYENTLKPAMESLGYAGIMMKRQSDDFDEGEATFWKTSRFTLVKSETHCISSLAEKEITNAGLDLEKREAVQKYIAKPDVVILTQLRCNNTNNVVNVGNIHVQWGKMEVPDIQCVQIACSIKALSALAGNDTQPHVLCGDFNSEATSPGYQLVLEGYLHDDMIDKLQSIDNVELPDGSKKALFNQLYRAFQHPSPNIKSSYRTASGSEPSVTSYNRVMRAAVDYIFYSAKCLDNVGVLEVAAESDITSTGGIPDATFPSDHVSMKSTFSFKV